MPFNPPRRQVNFSLTEREFAYLRRYADQAGKRPAGWVYQLVRERLLLESRKERATTVPPVVAPQEVLASTNSDGTTLPPNAQALTSRD